MKGRDGGRGRDRSRAKRSDSAGAGEDYAHGCSTLSIFPKLDKATEGTLGNLLRETGSPGLIHTYTCSLMSE